MNEQTNRNMNLPVYNIKAVSRLVGLLPVTLRAWERRYGLPRPDRGEQGYRLYTERDVRMLRWLKMQIDSGWSIGRAIDYLHELRSGGFDPADDTAHLSGPLPTQSRSPSLEGLANELLEVLTHFNDAAAIDVMRRALALYSVDQVLLQVVQPTLVTLGDAWHRGALPIAVEHFATQFCMQHLMSLQAAAAPPSRAGVIAAACAPGEMHQIGLLMLVVILRWRGWDVKYLGPDLPLDRLGEALRPLRPQVLMFSANRVESARKLEQLPAILAQFSKPHPFIVLGGQAFSDLRLPEQVPAIYLQASPSETVERIEALMVPARPCRGQKNEKVKAMTNDRPASPNAANHQSNP